MTALLEFQRTMARAVMQPLTLRDTLRHDSIRLESIRRETAQGGIDAAVALVKPNSRMTSFERLEIYSRSYWSRLLDTFSEDFPGVRAVLGARRFERLRRAYLDDCPSESFTMRNLGRQLRAWMEMNPALVGENNDLALDMAKLEWAEIESFDAADEEPIGAAEIAALEPDCTLRLQPCLRVMEARYEVDRLLLEIRASTREPRRTEQHSNVPHLNQPHKAPRTLSAKKIAAARTARPLYLAIHRRELVVHYKRLDAEMFRLLRAIGQGMPMGEAIESAYAESPLTAEECARHVHDSFALYAALGWFCRPGAEASAEGSAADERIEPR